MSWQPIITKILKLIDKAMEDTKKLARLLVVLFGTVLFFAALVALVIFAVKNVEYPEIEISHPVPRPIAIAPPSSFIVPVVPTTAAPSSTAPPAIALAVPK